MTFFQNFTSLYLSMESRDELTEWQELFTKSLGRPASFIREDGDGQDIGACAGTGRERLCSFIFGSYLN